VLTLGLYCGLLFLRATHSTLPHSSTPDRPPQHPCHPCHPATPHQGPELQGKPRLAARLRFSEKTILTQFMDAVRRKLAPVRGIPTKAGGMQDPNADLKEIFDTIEAIPGAPAKLLDGFRKWARGE